VKQLLRTEDADLIEAASTLLGSDYVLADALGVSRRAVQRWAQGINPVPAGVWPLVAKLVEAKQEEFAGLVALAEEMQEALIRRKLVA